MAEKSGKSKIIFVYNADSGVFNLLSDVAHKFFSPQTYACNLCALTHSNFGMRKEWKEFLATLDKPLEFLHADEFDKQYKFGKIEFPAVFTEEAGKLTLAIDAQTINRCRSIADLKQQFDF